MQINRRASSGQRKKVEVPSSFYPMFSEFAGTSRPVFRGITPRRAVNALQILVRHVFCRIPDLVHDAQTVLGFRKHRFERVAKIAQIIVARDQNITRAAIFQLVKHGRPEGHRLGFTQPNLENILLSVAINYQHSVRTFLDNLAVLAHFEPDTVEKYDGIQLVERARLPFL
jgi:hypothetical protein